MQNFRLAAMAAGLVLAFAPSMASAQTVAEFLETANRIPRNPTALLHPGFKRLRDQVSTSFRTIRTEQETRVSRGEVRTICMPDSVPLDAQALLNRFNAIPPARRTMTVNQAMREWMAVRYPCSN